MPGTQPESLPVGVVGAAARRTSGRAAAAGNRLAKTFHSKLGSESESAGCRLGPRRQGDGVPAPA